MTSDLLASLQPVDGFLPALVLLFAFTIGHALSDFPLQGDFLSRGKNRHIAPPALADGKGSPKGLWVYLLSAHCLIQAGSVWVISGVALLAFVEFVLHWLIDFWKCEGKTSFGQDQGLHILCKVVYVALIWAGWV